MEDATLYNLIIQAGIEWDLECKDAYERGAFDVSRDGWIASAAAQYVEHRLPKTKLTKADLMEAVVAIETLARNDDPDNYGLQYYLEDEFCQILNEHLKLGVDLD